jgi:hypothetical protein
MHREDTDRECLAEKLELEVKQGKGGKKVYSQ